MVDIDVYWFQDYGSSYSILMDNMKIDLSLGDPKTKEEMNRLIITRLKIDIGVEIKEKQITHIKNYRWVK